ncbi:uncharacterized protein LOC135219608 isoform X5 [Macrobrachium nipponense]|uniref:uncharacterized protein LOC135219608 isoform X5 n=1 Tax=Macrobrachium nipponense TaxID=159736 RepID=UPI0030C885DE
MHSRSKVIMEEREVQRPLGFMETMRDIAKRDPNKGVTYNLAVLQASVAGQTVSIMQEKQQHQPKKRMRYTSDCSSTDPCFLDFYKSGRRYVRCELCFRYPDIVKQHLSTKRIPLIVQECGTLYNKASLIKHRKEVCHQEALKEHHQESPSFSKSSTEGVEKDIRTEDDEVIANKVGGAMIQLYQDAKQLNFIPRPLNGIISTSILASTFNLNRDPIPLMSTDSCGSQQDTLDPLEYLQYIVESNENQHIIEEICDAVALSLHCSGNVDKMGIDKFYVRAKVVTKTADVKVYFLGVGEPLKRSAKSVLSALESACSKTVGTEFFKTVVEKTSSIVVDGISLDVKERETMWLLMRQLQKVMSTPFKDLPPLLINWCNVHRADLAWESVSQSVEEVNHVFQNVISICRLFHQSSIRLGELREISKENNLTFKSLPRLIEIRWSDFTANTLSQILLMWSPLTLYAQRSQDKEAAIILGFLKKIDNLHILTFLADVLSVFSSYQENLMRESVTLVNIIEETEEVKKTLSSLIKTPLLGGWVAALEEELVGDNNTGMLLHGVLLSNTAATFRCVVNDKMSIRTKVVKSLMNFLEQNLVVDERVDSIKSFVALSFLPDLKAAYNTLCPDFEEEQFEQEYVKLVRVNNVNNIRKLSLHDLVRTLASSNASPVLMTAYSRILAAKHYWTDCVEIASLSNKLDTSRKLILSAEVQSLYLYVHYNLPAMCEWDPKRALTLWLNRNRSRVNRTR